MYMIRVAARLAVTLLLFSGPVAAAVTQLKSISLATADHRARLLLDFSAPIQPHVTHDTARQLLLIRLENTAMAARLRQPPDAQDLVGNVAATNDGHGMNIRVDLKKAASIRSFPGKQGHQWIIQLTEAHPAPDRERAATKPAKGEKAPQRQTVAAASAKERAHAVRERVVVIDAGHGGKDTGAIGPGGTREKDVVFAIARKLADMIRAEPGMHPVLTRKSDQFVELRQRAEIARLARADMFISLHADAYVNADARGSSVFTLSENGASSVAARWLADRENSADLVGGVKLRDKGKMLASVLLELSQNATIEDSDRAATRILTELQKNHHLHHRQVQKAGFVVLKSPDVPSLLVETAFISNPDEERNLLNDKYQEQIARSIFWGIRSYFASGAQHQPPRPEVKTAGGHPELVAQE